MSKSAFFFPFWIKLFKILPWSKIIPFFLFSSAIVYGIFGWSTTFKVTSKTTQSEANQIIKEYEKSNPKFAADITNMRQQFGETALAAKIRLDSEAMNKALPIPRLTDYFESNTLAPELPLVQMAVNTDLRDNSSELTSFINEFYPAVLLQDDLDVKEQLLSDLKAASQSPKDWEVVSAHLAGPFAYRATRNTPSLWDYYSKNHSWLAESLLTAVAQEILLLSDIDDSTIDYDISERIQTLLATAQKYDLLFSQVRQVNEIEIAIALKLFELHGELIKTSVERSGLPIVETLAILYANPDYFESMVADEKANRVNAEKNSALLADIWRSHQNVWKYAVATPLSLKLYKDAPQSADAVLEKCGSNPSFLLQLYTAYDQTGPEGKSETMPFVADAIAKYGDLAIFTLHQYQDNPNFRDALSNPSIGSRIIPFVARFSDQLDDLIEDPRWIDRYFDQEGKAIDHERWWEALPGGSFAKVAINWADNKPTTWSELGWSVFDVADVGLLVFTVGTSKIVTSGAKATLRTGARVAGTGIRAADKAGDTIRLLRRIEKIDDTSTVLKSTRKIERGALIFVKQESDTVYKRFIQSTEKWAGKLDHIANPKNVRIWRFIGYALASCKLYAKWDTFRKAPTQIGELAGKLTQETLQVAGESLAGFAQQFIPQTNSIWLAPLFHGFIVALLLAFSFFSWFFLQHKSVNAV